MSQSPLNFREKRMRSPRGDQKGTLSYSVVSTFTVWSSRFRIRRPVSFADQTRKTMRLPSGDQLGNPALGEPWVRTCAPVPSFLTFMMVAGFDARSPKKPPNPNASHWPSGDHVG